MIKYCNACSFISQSTSCISCNFGLYPTLDKTKCLACNNIYSNCYKCSVDGSGVTTCASCLYNFYFNGTDCVECISPCSTCTNLATNCVTCIEGYYLNSSTCLQKPVPIGSGTYGGTCDVGGSQIACGRGCEVCSCASVNTKTCDIPL